MLLGTAVAARDGFFHGWRLLIALIGAVAIQAGTNLINDYYDFRSGADSHGVARPQHGDSARLLTPDQVWRGGIVAFAIGAALRPGARISVRMADFGDRDSQRRGRILLHCDAGVARLHRARRVDRIPFHGAGDRARLRTT